MVSAKQSPFLRLFLTAASVVVLVCLSFSTGFVVSSLGPRKSESTAITGGLSGSGMPSVFGEAWDLIVQDFYGPLPSGQERIHGAVRGLLSTLNDPYTVLVEPIPRQLEQDSLRGSYGGIGAGLSRSADGDAVLSPYPASPAAEAGIEEGDILLKVDAVLITAEMDLTEDVTALLRGEVGSTVTLTIGRNAESLVFVVTRQLIDVPSVTWRLLEQAQNIGYVQITTFTDRTVDELSNGVHELLSRGAEGLILDLRENGGGLLQASIDVADQFLDGGVVLFEKRRGQSEKTYLASAGGAALDIPLVVLVNQGTASAAEIVAGAIQDRERGELIGQPTFGKGSVQLIFDLSDGSSLHVTAARWYTPNRHQLDGVGLTPDIVVAAAVNASVDEPLLTGIALLEQSQ